MIEANRLEKLIEQDATIYYADKEANIPIPIFLNKKNLDKKEESCGGSVISTEDLYETYKDAERALKHHATRIEELNLPMWEEFKENNKLINFIAKDGQCYELGFAFGDTETICFDKVTLGVNCNQKQWRATEENYEKACDLCLKLFKGESDGKD